MRFVPADPLDQDAVLAVQQAIRAKLLAYAASRGFLEPDEVRDMLACAHGGGFSLNSSGEDAYDILALNAQPNLEMSMLHAAAA